MITSSVKENNVLCIKWLDYEWLPYLMAVVHSRYNLSEEAPGVPLRDAPLVTDVVVQVSPAGILHHYHNFVFVLKYWNKKNTFHLGFHTQLITLMELIDLDWLVQTHTVCSIKDALKTNYRTSFSPYFTPLIRINRAPWWLYCNQTCTEVDKHWMLTIWSGVRGTGRHKACTLSRSADGV